MALLSMKRLKDGRGADVSTGRAPEREWRAGGTDAGRGAHSAGRGRLRQLPSRGPVCRLTPEPNPRRRHHPLSCAEAHAAAVPGAWGIGESGGRGAIEHAVAP